MPCGKMYEKDSQFGRTSRIKYEQMEALYATMTNEQNELLAAYFEADAKIEDMIEASPRF